MLESLGYNNILVVIDQFSKEAVFIPCIKEENAFITAMTHLFLSQSPPASPFNCYSLSQLLPPATAVKYIPWV